MGKNWRGYNTRTRLPQGLVAVLPAPARERWDAMNHAYDTADEAAAVAATARATANGAEAADATAAREAARVGKKPPASTVAASAISATEAERYAAALADLAAEAQYDFTATLTRDRSAFREAVAPELAAAVAHVTDLLHATSEPMQQVSLLAGVLVWCDLDVEGMPGAKRVLASFNGVEQDVSAFLDVVERAVAAEHPDAVAARRAAAHAAWQESQGVRATVDGVIVDRGSIGALRSMASD